MRGYGESDKPQGVHNYEIGMLSNDVDELITLLGKINNFLAQSNSYIFVVE